ncbi:MAG: hypothetical protein IAF38_03495 [Bacteroidia bacterium]|nr:hypothetical protein [Bacteroidia bacterium]
MFKGLTYKKRNKLMIVVFVFMLFISWSFGYKKTFAAISDCNEMQSRAETAKDLPEKEEALRKDMILLESKIGSNKDSLAFQQKLLKELTSFCDSIGLTVKEYPGAETKQEIEYIVETHQFVVQGNFHSLVKLVNHLEHKSKTGKIAEADFRKVKDNKTKREQLNLYLYINHIINISEK